MDEIPAPDKTWYSVDELAERWGMKSSWVRDHATRKAPRIRSRKFGRFLRFHSSDVAEFERRIMNRDLERKPDGG